MLAAMARPLFGIVYDLIVPQEDKSFSQIFRRFLHAMLVGCILIVVSQQFSNLNDAYAHKTEEFERSTRLYEEEGCAYYKGSSQARIKECSELNIIINSWPLARAISHVVKGWNTCLYLPCQELVRNIADQLQYKIAFILIALALSSYLFNFFSCTKKKSKEFYDKYRLKQTMKDNLEAIESILQKKQTTVSFDQPERKVC